MRKKRIVLVLVLVLALPLAALAKNITVKKVIKPGKKSAVTFNHTTHKKYDKCKTCHHKGKTKDSCSVTDCHAGPAGMKALHKNCWIDCHRAMKKGPEKCRECHK